jgi:putative ABC transport system permease protein
MLQSYLKIAWRNLWKNKLFSLINILGLALGMACSLLIMLWVNDELSMDKFHENDARLYRFMNNQHYTGVINTFNSTPGMLAENVVKDIPEIQMASQILWEETPLFRVGNVMGKERGRYVERDYLQMFSFGLAQGDPKTALQGPNNVVIAQNIADKYFKGKNPIGQTIRIDNNDNVIVTGVLKEIPKSSSIKFDFLMSFERWRKTNAWATQWNNNGPRCVALLAPNADVDKVNAKLKGYIRSKDPDNGNELFLQKYSESYLYSNFKDGKQAGGRIEYVKIFSMVAVFILLIACINFMNLATARSVKRAKEVGIRKVVGAYRGSLIGQFMGESLLVALLALGVSALLVLALLPTFNELTGKYIQLRLTQPLFGGLLLGLAAVTGLVAGSYPALFMSSLNPVRVLKGSLKFQPSATLFRRGLVVFQFSISIVLILGMLVVYHQLDFLQTKKIGFERENQVYIPIEGDLGGKYAAFKQQLMQAPGIKSVTCSQATPLQVGSTTGGVSWPGKDTTQSFLFSQNGVAYDYLKTMGITLAQGRDFDPSFGTDSTGLIINEVAAKIMNYKDPVGKEITFGGTKCHIVGVAKDFHHSSVQVAIDPLILYLQPKTENWGYVVVRTQAGQAKQALASMEQSFKKFNPNFPFEYWFTDQEFQATFRSESIISTLSNYFAFLAIFISCLGLFGLAAFTAEQRTKEIGIRKVLGASVTNLVGMLSKDFIVLVLIATLIAFPLAWYLMNDWLEKYAYRIEINWWIFALTALLAVSVALLTVSYQAIKAALMNPVKSLKTE